VDCQRFQIGAGQRDRFGLPSDQPVVLMVSALEATKRVSMGIEAVSRIRGAYLIVAGDGPLRGEIDRVAETLLPNRFKRLLVRPEDMPLLYQSADVFLHLSKIESFGNVYLEAMSSGVPIVAHDSPRTRWIVGDGEYLGPTDYPSDIAGRIENATRERSDRMKGRALRATEFSWTNIAKKYQVFLREVLER
jgi:glycosyltransferase involved in cell wall biosynthesis